VRNSRGCFLVVQRSDAGKHFQGWWEFPGGKIGAGESPHAAVVRETLEEVGLSAKPDTAEPVWRTRAADGSVEYAFFTWTSPETEPVVRLSSEHSTFRWVTPTQAWKLQLLPMHREFMERVWHKEQIKAYETMHPRYELLQKTLEKVLNRVRKEWSPLAIVQARAKTISSFAEKCLRKADKYDDPVTQLTDLCGGRVITPTTGEAETICRQIHSLFDKVDEHEDTRQRHGLAAFGYLSVHFIVHFRADQAEMLGIPIPPEIAGLRAEIQVRTLLQHAHSEVTHDRLYKGGFKAPEHCEREAARVAALLEELDETFGRFVHQLDSYVGHYAAHLEPARRQREQDNLRLVIEHESDSARKPALVLRLARLARAAWDWPGVVDCLKAFDATASLQQEDIQMELGNALCNLHRGTPASFEYQRGLKLLTAVAQPEAAADSPVEIQPRIRRATALAWLGSALSRTPGRREDARNCLSKAVQLAPEDPYHMAAFVELDVVAGSSDDHLALLAPSLQQAARRCEDHVRAGIEVPRAWLTLAKIRLLLGDECGAIEALCLAAQSVENHHPLADFQHSLELLKDAIGGRRVFVNILNQAALLLIKAQENSASALTAEQWLPFAKQFDYSNRNRVLILAGSTAEGTEAMLRQFEPDLRAGLDGFAGCILTGGTDAGVCGLAARLVAESNGNNPGAVDLIGYLPAGISAAPAFKQVVRSAKTSLYSALEPLQMWGDLLTSGVSPSKVTLLCLGGGNISAQELALAWAFGARAVVVDDGGVAASRFAALLNSCGTNIGRGVILPNDPATISALISFDRPVDPKRWEKAAMAAHQAYLDERTKHPTKSNLVPWSLLRDDFKHSNRHQIACAVDILRRAGFAVTNCDLPGDKIPQPEFTTEDVERMAELEHGRWNVERFDSGWRYGDKKDEERKLSPYLVPWRQVPEDIRLYDREAVRTWPKILAQAGFQVSRR